MKILNNRTISLSCLLGLAYHAAVLAIPVEVKVIGVNDDIQNNILAGLSLYQSAKNRDLDSQQVQLLHSRAKEEIQVAVQPFGYYHSQVQAALTTTPEGYVATYSVTLGEPTRIDELNFNLTGPGTVNPNLKNIFSNFPLKKNDVFEHAIYEQGKTDLQQKAFNEGYIQNTFTRKDVIVDLSRYLADINLDLDTGPQFTLGHVTFTPGYYDEHFLQRFVHIEPNEPYRLSTIVKFEERLIQSGLFKGAQITPEIPEDGTVVPLKVDLDEAPANRYLIGVGYDTNTRSRLRLGWDRKKITRRGHQFKSDLKLSEKDTLINAYYSIPGKRPWSDQYRIAVGYADDEYRDRPSELYTAELSETRDIWGLKRTIALRYLNETFYDSNGQEERSTFLLPSIRLSKSKVDNISNPRNGYRIDFFVRGGIDALFSDSDFIQLYLQYKWLRAISEAGTIIARTELGATFPDNIEDLPLSIRFYAGGIDSLRGFRYRSLPFEVDKDGQLNPVGGAYLILGTLEYNHTLYGPLKGAIFVDGGSALRKLDDDYQLAAGVGLRWQTPIGPLKLDIAKPLSAGAEVWRLHFSFGPEL